MTPVYDFTWKGRSAHEDFGVEVLEIGSTVIAERRDTATAIPGRSGLVHSQDGAVEEVEHTITIYLPYEQGRHCAPMGDIRKWLKGYGRLALSTIPDRYMLAHITDQISLDPIIEGFADRKGRVIFRCDPWLYHTDAPEITLTENAVLSNPGTAPAAPIITINATGDMDLMIGGQTILLTGLTGSITLNSMIEEAYGQDENNLLLNMNNHMAGDFPMLDAGDVAISWSLEEGASLESIVIQPNWRDEN